MHIDRARTAVLSEFARCVFQAPEGMRVLMSATQSTYEEQEGVYQFYMEYPVPAYLVALVAGDLVPADIGPR